MRTISEDFLIMAHRGASGYELENSYAAFTKAVELGAPMIETDVRETADGILILNHDYSINRTAQGKGKIKNLPIQEIKKVPLNNNEHIPVLGEVLAKFGEKVRFNLEIKVQNIEMKLYDLLAKYKQLDRTLISSFSFKTLQKFYQIDQNLHLALITLLPWPVLRLKYSFERLLATGITAINPKVTLLSKSFVQKAHQHGVKIYPWTVNESALALKLRDNYQVDGIITNFPDLLKT